MSSSNQPTREPRNHEDVPRGPQRHHGSVDPQEARGVPVDTNQYHPYAQPAFTGPNCRRVPGVTSRVC